ncbi:MAG: tyrosine-type recombinase/integrase, partial [Burkholderiaceae bacterium]|nr:tyrosine-type recombinase/integrase [Burkholderiaceae bacterium]
IKTFFTFLRQSGYLKENPATDLIPPAIPRRERRFLSETEYQALLAQASSVRDRAILMLFLQTGLRLSELTHLRVSDVERPRRVSQEPEHVGLLKVRRKGAKEEVLPVNWKACEALAAWLRERALLLKGHRPHRPAVPQQVPPALEQAGGAKSGDEVSGAGGDPQRLGAHAAAHDGDPLPGEGWGSQECAGAVGPRIAGDDADLRRAGQEGAAQDGAGTGAMIRPLQGPGGRPHGQRDDNPL